MVKLRSSASDSSSLATTMGSGRGRDEPGTIRSRVRAALLGLLDEADGPGSAELVECGRLLGQCDQSKM